MIRELVAAMSIGQNPETTRWMGAATQDVPLDERQTVVILLLPFRTKTTNPCGPAASVAHWMACGPLAARVQVAPSVELHRARPIVTNLPPCAAMAPNPPTADGTRCSVHEAPPSDEVQDAACPAATSVPVSTMPGAPPVTPRSATASSGPTVPSPAS